LEGVSGLRSPGEDCEDRSREEADIGAGMGVHMSILEVSFVVMSDMRAVSWAESLRMTKTKTVYGGSVAVISQRRAVVQTR
jgi:hypothetical protein